MDFGAPPPYYLAAPNVPSQPAPQPQIVDRQAYWLGQRQNVIDAQNTIQFNQNGPSVPFQRNDTETAFASPVGPDEGANTQPDWSYGGDPSQWYKDQLTFGPNSGYLQNRWVPNGGQLLDQPPFDRGNTANGYTGPYPLPIGIPPEKLTLAQQQAVLRQAEAIRNHFMQLNQMGIERQQQLDQEATFAAGLPQGEANFGQTINDPITGTARQRTPLVTDQGNNPLPAVAGAFNTLLNPISEGARWLGEHQYMKLGGAGTLGGPTTPEEREQIGQAYSLAAPAAVSLIPGVGPVLGIAYTAQGVANAANIGSMYVQGQISGKDALIQLALTAPQLLPIVLKGSGALSKWAQSPEGQAALADVRAKVGTGIGKLNEAGGKIGLQSTPVDENGNPIPMSDIIKGEQAPDTTASAGIDSIVKKVRTAIVTARKLGPEQERMIAEQKAIRVKGAAQRLEEGGGLSAFHESKSFLAGEYTKPTFEPLDLAPEDVNALVDHIGMSGADYFDRLGALTALEKATMGIKPAENELAKLDKILPKAGIRQAYEAQAMAGEVRGFDGPSILPDLGPMGDAGAVQGRLEQPGAFDEFKAQAVLRDIQSKLDEARRAQMGEALQVLDSARRQPSLPNVGTQARLEAPGAFEEYKANAVLREIQGRLGEAEQAQMGQALRALDIARRQPRLSNVGGMQTALPNTRLADAVNEAYVGAVAAGKEGIEANANSRFTKILQNILSPLQLMKTIKTSFDIGWGGRQGWRLLPRNPAEWFRMYGKQFRAFKNEANFNEIDAATKAFPNFERSQQAARPLAYLERGTGSVETSGEEFVSGITRHLWGLRGSERAYVAPGNWMRQAVLDKQVRRIVDATHAPVTDADFQLLIDNLNNATLRGNTKWLGTTNAQTLASLAFSIKGQVSGPQFALDAVRAVLNGGGRYSPEARKIVAEQFGAYVGMGMSTLGLVAATGWSLDKAGKPSYVNVDLNDLSPTFGQINVGGFRWNYWGADQSLVRNAIQIARGKQQWPGLPAQGADRRRLVNNLIRTKIAPGIPSLAYDELVNKGRNPYPGATGLQQINSPLGFLAYVFEQAAPIAGENAFQAYQDLGPRAVLPSFLAETHGLATSTYNNAPTEDQLKKVANTKLGDELTQAGLPTRDQPYADQSFRDALSHSFDVQDMPKTYDEFRTNWIDAQVKSGVPRSEAVRRFNLNPIVKGLDSQLNKATLAFWKAHPDLLKRAIESGATDSSEEKVKILADAR